MQSKEELYVWLKSELERLFSFETLEKVLRIVSMVGITPQRSSEMATWVARYEYHTQITKYCRLKWFRMD